MKGIKHMEKSRFEVFLSCYLTDAQVEPYREKVAEWVVTHTAG